MVGNRSKDGMVQDRLQRSGSVDHGEEKVHGADTMMTIRGYVIAGTIILILLFGLYACLRVSRRAEDEDKKWRDEHERYF